MNRPYDIRVYKRRLRERYKSVRQNMKPEYKALCDSRILARVTSLSEYKRAKTLLCFVSTAIEVDTHGLIRQAIADRKTVAVPYCLDGTRKMRFYRIRSLEELTPRTFGVLEPDPTRADLVTDFHDAICILPGIVFDRDGFRLGYGGGYYDRFLSRSFIGKGGVTAGICYSNCTLPYLHRGRYDMPCDILVTDKYVRRPKRYTQKKQAPEQGLFGGKRQEIG